MQLLLSHGAEVNPKDESLIITAIDSRNYNAIKTREDQIEGDKGEDHFTSATQLYQRFINAGRDREAGDNDGNTPIFYYASAPKPSILREHWDHPRPSNPEDYKKMFSEHDVHKINHKGDSLLHAIA
ncbi:hypothetical protein PENSUB_12675 [Penicillium subrubescens]|uniref:Ankyrin repeat protein n=1 Tax=Penicillium subrubescens TaxID=1316194 RepID=A0A1Q5SXL8_9EURO|nr:hypothetical protein PENSUB_12675 [Penicillium subrubescens]